VTSCPFIYIYVTIYGFFVTCQAQVVLQAPNLKIKIVWFCGLAQNSYTNLLAGFLT
jgi:hypothetical protein